MITPLITQTQLSKILPINKYIPEWVILLNKKLPVYDITTKNRVVMFLSQCSHESTQFTQLRENLNYSSERLLEIFPKYFNKVNSIQFHRNPVAIANRVYANRMGNGNEASGDGWLYRGRGLIGMTGKDSYTKFASYMNMTLPNVVSYMETREGALESALYFWKNNNINYYSDRTDILGATKRINGGTNGIDLRKIEYNKISSILI